MVVGEWTETSRHILCLGIYTFGDYARGTAANRPLHFQGIDFQKVHLIDGLSSGLGLSAGGIADMEKAIMEAIGSKGTVNDGVNVTLVLDGLDFLLAATGCEGLRVLDMIGELKEVRSHCPRKLAPYTC